MQIGRRLILVLKVWRNDNNFFDLQISGEDQIMSLRRRFVYLQWRNDVARGSLQSSYSRMGPIMGGRSYSGTMLVRVCVPT